MHQGVKDNIFMVIHTMKDIYFVDASRKYLQLNQPTKLNSTNNFIKKNHNIYIQELNPLRKLQ